MEVAVGIRSVSATNLTDTPTADSLSAKITPPPIENGPPFSQYLRALFLHRTFPVFSSPIYSSLVHLEAFPIVKYSQHINQQEPFQSNGKRYLLVIDFVRETPRTIPAHSEDGAIVSLLSSLFGDSLIYPQICFGVPPYGRQS